MNSDDFRVPDVVGYITAWRAWQVEAGIGLPRLASMNGQPWDAVELSAVCNRSCGQTPGEKCTCGIYAAKDRRHLRDMGYNNYAPGRAVAIGEVLLWGKVIPGTQGYRAEHARIGRLWLPYEHASLARPLRDRYRVPVGLARTFGKEV